MVKILVGCVLYIRMLGIDSPPDAQFLLPVKATLKAITYGSSDWLLSLSSWLPFGVHFQLLEFGFELVDGSSMHALTCSLPLKSIH